MLSWINDVPYAEKFDDTYYHRQAGLAETEFVFLQGNQLENRLAQSDDFFQIVEFGFGTGLNFVATLRLIAQLSRPHPRVQFISVEKYPLDRSSIQRALQAWPELNPWTDLLLQRYPPDLAGWHILHIQKCSHHLVIPHAVVNPGHRC